MLDKLVRRDDRSPVAWLTTTVTDDNRASWALFEAFARRQGATLERTLRFDKADHFNGAHDSEWQARIGPLAPFDTISNPQGKRGS